MSLVFVRVWGHGLLSVVWFAFITYGLDQYKIGPFHVTHYDVPRLPHVALQFDVVTTIYLWLCTRFTHIT